jgi:tetratricopeptide (TPR) repeat protein
VYYASGDLVKAGDLAAQILMLDSKAYSYLLVRSEASLAGGDYVKASTMLDAYARGGRKERSYYLLRSRLQSEWNKSPTAAAETLGQALLLYPDDCGVLLATARVASDGNMKVAGKTALEFARTVLKQDGENVEAAKICIKELSKEGSYEEAYALSAPLMTKDCASALVHTHIAVCIALGKLKEAESFASALYERNRKDIEVQKSYVKVLVATGRKNEAQDMIASLMADADASMKSFLYYEQSFLSTDDREAVARLRSSLTQNPRNTDSLTRLYEIYYNKKDWKRAQYYLKQVIALNPSNKKALAMSQKLDKELNN